MKLLISLMASFCLLVIYHASLAQTPSTAPMIAGCPNPIPNQKTNIGWPDTSCKYQFYPLTDTVHAIASVSKSTPIYQHTYPAYGSTTMIVACPKGATVLGVSCKDSSGKDASVMAAKSSIPNLSIAPISVTASWTVTWQAPTSYTDGTPIGPGELTGYNVYLTPSGSGQQKLATLTPGTLSYKTQPLAPGLYAFSVSALAGSRESAQTGVMVTVTAGGAKIPGAPTNVQAK